MTLQCYTKRIFFMRYVNFLKSFYRVVLFFRKLEFNINLTETKETLSYYCHRVINLDSNLPKKATRSKSIIKF